MSSGLAVAPWVMEALEEGRSVVALETAVLTHGLPRPANLETFRAVEEAVVEKGGVPAPVAVLDGQLRVGTTPEENERLATSREVQKAGIGDLPALLAREADAGTTVAASLWAARAAGVRVLATGGIGGVHRDARSTFDVSGDLPALSRYGGCVVCSGAKAVLDLPKTLQALETLGVCTLGFRTDVFPAFVCVDSGLRLAHRVDDPAGAARVVRARDALGLAGAVLLANPPPVEHAVSREELEACLPGALEESRRRSVSGPDVTPFLLDALASASGGATLEANRALLVANARLGARVAACLPRET